MKAFQNKGWSITVILYSVFLTLPLYWLVVLSLQPNNVSQNQANIFPNPVSFENYLAIFFQDNWVDGYLNTLMYVFHNIISIYTSCLCFL